MTTATRLDPRYFEEDYTAEELDTAEDRPVAEAIADVARLQFLVVELVTRAEATEANPARLSRLERSGGDAS